MDCRDQALGWDGGCDNQGEKPRLGQERDV